MSVTLHTTIGDLKVELYCESCPKTCENFLALCASGYYNDCIFHRNIRGFIVQTGDPTGTGKGGQSVWGDNFADEFKAELKHDVRGILSSANNGQNTNGSQFFFTYAKHPHLDLKYTVFGRIIDGFDSLDDLEEVKVDEKYRVTRRVVYRISMTTTCINLNEKLIKNIEASKENIKKKSNNNEKMSIEDNEELRKRQMSAYYSQYLEHDYYEPAEKTPSYIPEDDHTVISSERGISGVFELEQLATVLISERALDLVCISMSELSAHADYLMLCTGRNGRHIEAIMETLRKLYNGQKYHSDPPFLVSSGTRKLNQWQTVHLGNVQLHVMNQTIRNKYDLEQLWTIGLNHDSECLRTQHQKYPWLDSMPSHN